MNLLEMVSDSSDIVPTSDLVSTTCSDPGLAQILKIIRTFLKLVQIIGPIIAMVALVMNLIKLMSNPDNKKYATLIRNWAIALFMLFLLPVFINLVMGWLDGSFSVASCWSYLD